MFILMVFQNFKVIETAFNSLDAFFFTCFLLFLLFSYL